MGYFALDEGKRSSDGFSLWILQEHWEMFSFGLIQNNYMIRDPSLPLKSAHPIEAGRPSSQGTFWEDTQRGGCPPCTP